MDTTEYAEGQYLSTEVIKASPTKKLYVCSDARVVEGKFGDKLELDTEIDGKKKKWGLNRDHVKSLQAAYGKESKNWIGKTVDVRVVSMNGKETILAVPQEIKVENIR